MDENLTLNQKPNPRRKSTTCYEDDVREWRWYDEFNPSNEIYSLSIEDETFLIAP